jgi:hypothetical protein
VLDVKKKILAFRYRSLQRPFFSVMRVLFFVSFALLVASAFVCSLLIASRAAADPLDPHNRRPVPRQRLFVSQAVEDLITDIHSRMKDPDLASLFLK